MPLTATAHPNALFGCPRLLETNKATIIVNDMEVVFNDLSPFSSIAEISSPHSSSPESSLDFDANLIRINVDHMNNDILSDGFCLSDAMPGDDKKIIPLFRLKRKLSPTPMENTKKRGLLLTDITPNFLNNTPAIECDIDHLQTENAGNNTRLQQQLRNIGIVHPIKFKYPEITNDSDFTLTDKFKYFESGSTKYERYTDRQTDTSLNAYEKRLMEKIVKYATKQTDNLQTLLRAIEQIKKKHTLTETATDIELEQLAQLYKSLFWMSVYLHQIFLALPVSTSKVSNPSLLSFQETFINILNFFTTRISIKASELYSISSALKERLTNTEPSPHMDYAKARKMTKTVAQKANRIKTMATGQLHTISIAQHSEQYAALSPLNKSWLGEIVAQLEKIIYLCSYPYFGLSLNSLDETAATNLYLYHPRAQFAVTSAMQWMEYMLHLSSQLFSEGLHILSEHINEK